MSDPLKPEIVKLDDYLFAGGSIDDLILNATEIGEQDTAASTAKIRVAQLAELTEIEFEQSRSEVAKELGVRAASLERWVKEARRAKAEKLEAAKSEPPPPPWQTAVATADLLDSIVHLLSLA